MILLINTVNTQVSPLLKSGTYCFWLNNNNYQECTVAGR